MQQITLSNRVAVVGAGILAAGALLASVMYFRKVNRYEKLDFHISL